MKGGSLPSVSSESGITDARVARVKTETQRSKAEQEDLICPDFFGGTRNSNSSNSIHVHVNLQVMTTNVKLREVSVYKYSLLYGRRGL